MYFVAGATRPVRGISENSSRIFPRVVFKHLVDSFNLIDSSGLFHMHDYITRATPKTLSHLAESNRGHRLYERRALPTELRWQLKRTIKNIPHLAFFRVLQTDLTLEYIYSSEAYLLSPYCSKLGYFFHFPCLNRHMWALTSRSLDTKDEDYFQYYYANYRLYDRLLAELLSSSDWFPTSRTGNIYFQIFFVNIS